MIINVHTDLHCKHIQLLMHTYVLYTVCSCDAKGVALSVQDEWLMFCVGMCSMDTSSYTITKLLPVMTGLVPRLQPIILPSRNVNTC